MKHSTLFSLLLTLSLSISMLEAMKAKTEDPKSEQCEESIKNPAQSKLKENLTVILTRFRQEIESQEVADYLTEQEISTFFPDLAKEPNAFKKIKDFIVYFAANISKKTITKKSKNGFFVNTQDLYCYPAQAKDGEPFLSTCACKNFVLGDRVLLTLKQLNDLVKKHPDKLQQLVHTSIAAGGAGEPYGCALLQLFMLVKGLFDFGYQKLFVKPIDKYYGNDTMFGEDFMHFVKEQYGSAITMHIAKIDTPFDPLIIPDSPYLIFKPYKSTQDALEDEKAPQCHSFDIIDISSWKTNKQTLQEFCKCIEKTSAPEALIYEGNGNEVTRLSLDDITEFQKIK